MMLSQDWRRFTESLPNNVYASVVNSLFDNLNTLIAGMVSASIAAFITAWKTSSRPLLICAILLTVIGICRSIDMIGYRLRGDVSTKRAAKRWEVHYAIGAGAYSAALGFWWLISFLTTSDSFVQLLCAAITIGYACGTSGRNYGVPNVVTLQIVCTCVPLAFAMLARGDVYYIILACFILPFFFALKKIASSLNQTLLKAVISAEDVTLLAGRLDAALNNMPQGLCMVGGDSRIVVANGQFAQILGLDPQVPRVGARITEVLVECIRSGLFSASAAGRIVSDFKANMEQRTSGRMHAETQAGRTFAVTFQPTGNGGSVLLLEDITERRSAEAKIKHLASYDALTGLPNRTFFRSQMDRALSLMRRSTDQSALLFVDLDEFKQINDTMGHPTGDALLCAVADRLQRIVRETDVIGRFGGDEFVVLQSPVGAPEEAAALAKRVVETLSEPYEIEGHQLIVGASIGIAMTGQHEVDADHLLRNADMALYRAKAEGRGTWCFFEPEMDVTARARRTLESDLRKALADESFQIFFQPLVNIRTGRVSTCEALLRWTHPERGMVSPAEFVPVAEEMGIINELGVWVLRKACQECAAWPTDVRVAVNLSSMQFRRGNMTGTVREALWAAGLPAERLEVEITESVLLQDTEATRVTLTQLHDLGVRISLDDFGTGYSSLSYLHSFPLQKVKIDRSFLQGIQNGGRSLTLLRGVARMSDELGMSVAIEGVETQEQLDLVAAEPSITEVQGFLFSPAVSSSRIRELLQSDMTAATKVA